MVHVGMMMLKLEQMVHVGVMMLKLETRGACGIDDAKA